jgi:hypothetical protein
MTTIGPGALPDPGSELSRLAAGFCDSSLTVADRDRLVALLGDPQARAAYRKIVWLHANLIRLWSQETSFMAWSPQPLAIDEESEPATGVVGGPWQWAWPTRWADLLVGPRARRTAGIVVGAVLTAAAVTTAILMVAKPFESARPPVIMRPPRVAGAIAEVVAVESPTWKPDSRVWTIWDGLLPGAILELQSGRIELVFDGDTRVVLEGPAQFVVDGPSAVSLRRGKAAVTVRKAIAAGGRSGFTLDTPTATVTDIGTSFGVAVDQAGETSVTVFDGLVDLLPRTDGAVPLRLAAGEAGAVSKRQAAQKTVPSERRFVRSLDRPAPHLQAVLASYGWDEANATTIYRDSFNGSGPLGGSRPADRGGLGDTPWVAPLDGWQLDAARDRVVVTSHGSALLPIAVEPGRLYLISAAIHATAGGLGWGAVGFTNQSRPDPYLPHGPWMLQRHDAVKHPNEIHVGPDEARPVGRGDRLIGEHTRSMLLDTKSATWRVVFFADGKAVGESRVDPVQAGITHVCLAAFPNTQVSFRHFSVSSSSHPSLR